MRKATGTSPRNWAAPPTDAELARHLGVTDEELHEARQADMFFTRPRWTPRCQPGGRPAKLADLIGADDPDRSEHRGHGRGRRALGRAAVAGAAILLMRFYGNLTQAEIGDRLGISQMHVSRLLTRALTHLKSKMLDESDEPRFARPPNGIERDMTSEGLS